MANEPSRRLMDRAYAVGRAVRVLGLRVVALALSAALVSAGAVSLAACAHAHHVPSSHACPACVAAHPPGVTIKPPPIGVDCRRPVADVLPLPACGAPGLGQRDSVSPRGPPRFRSTTNAQLG